MQGGIRNVIFLGAGASAADGAPLQKDLLRDYFLTRRESRTAMDLELAQFFNAFYGRDITLINPETEFPTFEEVLGTLEMALSRDENFRVGKDVWNQDRIQQCREYVITLICLILGEKLGVYPTGNRNTHWRLAETLPRNGTTAFISLNYDLLVDNAISGVNRTIDYGTEFANPISLQGEPVGLYKLHGSLNWLRCPLCGSITNTGNEKGASYPLEQRPRCERAGCASETTPIVIPPTFFKVMSDFHLQQVWNHAETALVQAENLFFCGYSLPDADMHIRYLLKRTEVNRGATPRVFIMSNHDGKKPEAKVEEAGRYKRLFRDPSKVVYTKLSFEDFSNEGFSILNRSTQELTDPAIVRESA